MMISNCKYFFIKLIPFKMIRKKLRAELRAKEHINKLKAQVAISCDIGDFDFMLAQRTNFPHPVGIVASKHIRIGKNCIIYQNVTLGRGLFLQILRLVEMIIHKLRIML